MSQGTTTDGAAAKGAAVPGSEEGLIYPVDSVPPPGKLALLGLQMATVVGIYLVMMVIVTRAARVSPEVARSAVAMAPVGLGIGAMLQALWRGPVGSGFLAPPVLSTTYLPATLGAVALGGLPLVYGMTLFAGAFEMAFSRVLRHLKVLFPTLVCGLIVLAIGMELGLIGLQRLLDMTGRTTPGEMARHIAVGGATLGAMVGLSVWGRGIARLLSVLAGLLLGAGLSLAMGAIPASSLQAVRDAPIVGLPGLEHVSYVFEPAAVVPFLIAALAASLRATGVITTCQRINDPEWKRPDERSIAGGVLADGLGCAIGGGLGLMGMTVAPSAVGVSKVTGATSRYIAFAMGAWLLLCALLPKLAACFLALPDSVVGGALTYTGSTMFVGGLQLITAAPLDIRKRMVIGISVLLGLTRAAYPDFYAGLPHAWSAVTGSVMSITAVAAIALNLLFRIGIRRTAAATVETNQESLDQLAAAIRGDGKQWGVPADVVDAATAAATRIVQLLAEHHLARGPIQTRISFDEVSFTVTLQYPGELLHLPTRHPPEGEMAEEDAAVHGLASFLAELHPEQVRTHERHGQCEIQFVFAA